MPYVVNCPACKRQVSSDEQVEIAGKHYTVFHCPQCVERLGVARQSSARRLAFVIDLEGHVRRLSEVVMASTEGHKP